MNEPNRRSYVLMACVGLFSGLLSWVAIFLPPAGFAWMPGAVFGLAVGLPLTLGLSFRWARVVGSVVLGTFSYVVAYAVQGFITDSAGYPIILGTTAAGFVGSLLMGTGLPGVLGRWQRLDALAGIVVAGTVTGTLFGLIYLSMPGDNFFWPLKMALGFTLWQGGTAALMGRLRAQASR